MKASKFFGLLLLVLHTKNVFSQDDIGLYKVGVGISDITGPPTGMVLNGYINWVVGQGIWTRQFARAFMVESKESGNAVVYVTCDMGMIDHSMVAEVVKKLQAKYGETKFTQKNIMISATHTHSGVSGFMTYYAYLFMESKGWSPVTYWNSVDGIYEAIVMAVTSSQDGHVLYGQGILDQTNINRRRDTAYQNNPEWEKALYNETVDKEFTILRLETIDNEPIGVFTWFAVHPSDFNPGGKTPIISSDIKGMAAILLDETMNGNGTRPGQNGGKFVSGFGSQNVGGVYTDYDQCSTPREEEMIKEGKADFSDFTPYIERCRCSGMRQYWKALELFQDTPNLKRVQGPIRFSHQFVDAETIKVPHYNETSGEIEEVGLCKPAMGVAYFGELDPEGDLWEIIRDLVKPPSEEMTLCQLPKQIVVAAGEMGDPWEWAPHIFSIQLFMLGNVSVVGLPGEFTVMAGRRVARLVQETVGDGGKTIIAGLCNNYINYVATPEEYDYQAFEGGATIYGRNTIPVVSHLYTEMAKALMDNEPERIPSGPSPPSFLDRVKPNWPPHPVGSLFDPPNLEYGSVVVDAEEEYERGVDTQVKVTFVAGTPRHDSLRKGTFLTVERKDEETGRWGLWRTDADLDTGFYWGGPTMEGLLPSVREAEITWYINQETEAGLYRIKHFGYKRTGLYEVSKTYQGMSREFLVK